MPAYDEVKNAALELPFEARTQLVADILTSLEASQEEIDSAWRAEIERRVKEIEEGKLELIPGEQVMTELRDYIAVARPEHIPVPDWHREILSDRLKKYQAGQGGDGRRWEEFERDLTMELNHPPGE